MSTIVLEAELRTETGKGASRRLRRVHDKVLATVYGGTKKPKLLHLPNKNVVKALESESIFSSVFNLSVDGKIEHVILKDIQRHPYRPIILHMDFQRVSPKDVLVKMIPLHFLNQEEALGVKEGGIVNHHMNQVEVRCQAQHLPEYIEIDLANLALNEVIHLSQLSLPKDVQLAIDPTTGDHDHPVVSIHLPKIEVIEEEVIEDAEAELDAEASAEAEVAKDEAQDENSEANS